MLGFQGCSERAKSMGYSVFAIQNGGECWTTSNAKATYQKYGRSSNCKNGAGGSWANDVYEIGHE